MCTGWQQRPDKYTGEPGLVLKSALDGGRSMAVWNDFILLTISSCRRRSGARKRCGVEPRVQSLAGDRPVSASGFTEVRWPTAAGLANGIVKPLTCTGPDATLRNNSVISELLNERTWEDLDGVFVLDLKWVNYKPIFEIWVSPSGSAQGLLWLETFRDFFRINYPYLNLNWPPGKCKTAIYSHYEEQWKIVSDA